MNISEPSQRSARLYLVVVGRLQEAVESGVYPVGSRLPSERELSVELGVSRPVVREAIIVLESRGFVQTRHGAGVFVQSDVARGNVTVLESDAGPFEVLEASRLLGGEIASLAAESVTGRQIAELERLVDRIADANLDKDLRQKADRSFYITLARTTENDVLVGIMGMLWDLRYKSRLSEYFFRRAYESGMALAAHDHENILDALKNRDACAARSAMRDHLTRVTENLLIATEEDVRDRARFQLEGRRFAFARRAGVKVRTSG